MISFFWFFSIFFCFSLVVFFIPDLILLCVLRFLIFPCHSFREADKILLDGRPLFFGTLIYKFHFSH